MRFWARLDRTLVNTTAHRAANRHSHRPAKLNGLYVFTDPLAVLAGRKALQPRPNWFSAGLRPVKDGLNTFPLQVGFRVSFCLGRLRSICHRLVYHIRYINPGVLAGWIPAFSSRR